MVEPLHLMMFGCSSLLSYGKNSVKIDNWYVGSCKFVLNFCDLVYSISFVTISLVTQVTIPSLFVYARLPVKLSHRLACLVGGVRHVLEGLLLKVVADPSLCSCLPAEDDVVLNAVRSLMSSQLPPPTLRTGGFGRGHFKRGAAGFRGGRYVISEK